MPTYKGMLVRVRQKSILRVVGIVVLALVVAAMVVPYSVLEYALRHYERLRELADFIDTVAPGFEMTHLLAFGAVGFAAHFAWRNVRAWQLAIGCFAVASLTEWIQLWIPGREAAVSHAILNVAGGVAGFVVAWTFTVAWGAESTAMGPRHSTLRVGEDTES